MTSTPPPERLAVLFVHGVGIREPDYAESAIRGLRREFAKATGGHEGDSELMVESVYWAPAVMEREDRLLRAAFPYRAGIWFSGMNWLTHRISNGSATSVSTRRCAGWHCAPRTHRCASSRKASAS